MRDPTFALDDVLIHEVGEFGPAQMLAVGVGAQAFFGAGR
jgi:hypothetical protein